MVLSGLLLAGVTLFSYASANFPPTPQDITTKHIPSHPGVSISYKETKICETKAKGYAGYVHMPSSYLSDIETKDPYSISLFFWYFEARHNPSYAQTAIYLAGGPGESSLYGAAQDGGPCIVLPDSNSTAENPWSWNENVNMLYVDQPVGSGYSYDEIVKSTQDLLFLGMPLTETGITPMESYEGKVPEQNSTFLYGAFPSQNPDRTANSSAIAARTMWHFSQVWFTSFPEYKTCNKKISLWGNSYGGYWTSTTGAYFQQQNVKIKNGQLKGSHILELDTIGMTNGCLDLAVQGEFYPEMAYNNTYGVEIIPKAVYEESTHNFTKPEGCRDQIMHCRVLGDKYDPDQLAISDDVNQACVEAELYCAQYVLGAYDALSNRSDFDMAHMKPDPYPSSYVAGYFNQGWVQQALGSPVNFTSDSLVVNNVFLYVTGDTVRTTGLKHIEYLLDSGVKVVFVYGDRDYRCPWTGVENVALQAKWDGGDAFRDESGYEEIRVNRTYNGGVVRQHSNLTFARVFDSGHDVQAYQPETAYQIFNRAMSNHDIATGKRPTSGPHNNYTSHGPASSFGWKNKMPEPPKTACYLYNVGATCEVDQYLALANGTAEIVNFSIVKPVGGGGALQALSI